MKKFLLDKKYSFLSEMISLCLFLLSKKLLANDKEISSTKEEDILVSNVCHVSTEKRYGVLIQTDTLAIPASSVWLPHDRHSVSYPMYAASFV